ncbi:MAG: hypothetical protein AAFQ13_05530 [Pseudomonadota bacterium]
MVSMQSRWIALGGYLLILATYVVSGEIKRPGRLTEVSLGALPSLLLVPLFMGSWGYVMLHVRSWVNTRQAKLAATLVAIVYFMVSAGLTAYVVSLRSSTAGLGFIFLPIYASAVMVPIVVAIRWVLDREPIDD